jgi:TetR/AcrR family transcriptional regulator, mexJK operon transcriptional repressor
MHYCTRECNSLVPWSSHGRHMGTSSPRTAGPHGAAPDPRVVRSRAAIVEAAAEVFLERGYVATRVGDVASRAGVARRTIHNLYETKEQLFHAALTEALDTAERFSLEVADPLGGGDDVEDWLRDTGLRLARAVLGGRIVPLRRLLIAEAARFPELARDYYERAPGRVMTALAGALRRFDERGALRVEDPPMAAEHFAFLVIGASLDRALFDADGTRLSPEAVESRATAGVDAFLRAYRPGQSRRA